MALQLQYKYVDESLNAFLLRIYGTIDAMYNFIYINNIEDIEDFQNRDSFYIDDTYIPPMFSINDTVEIYRKRNEITGVKEYGQTLNDILISEYLDIDYLYEFLIDNGIENLKDVELHKVGTKYKISTTTVDKYLNYNFKISSGVVQKYRAFSKQFAKHFA